MSVKGENSAGAPVAHDSGRPDEHISGLSPDMIAERIEAKLEPLNAQISRLTQLLDQPIQGILARNSPTAGPRTYRACQNPASNSNWENEIFVRQCLIMLS